MMKTMGTDCSCSFLQLHSFAGKEPLVRNQELFIYWLANFRFFFCLGDEQATKQNKLQI